MLHLDCTVLSFDVSPSKVADRSPDWSRASSHSIDKFQDSVLQSLLHLLIHVLLNVSLLIALFTYLTWMSMLKTW